VISNNDKPLISVVLPAYNGENYIESAVNSILEQSYANFELIIINDGSTDSTNEILSKYNDSRIKLVSRENRGLVASLNEGIDKSKGEYIARMDADDISLENRFQEQVKLMNEGYDLCGCHFHLITESGKLSSSRVVSIDPDFQSIILTRSVPFAHGSVMMRKSFLLENDLKYAEDECSSAEDYQLWVKCFESGAKIGNVDEYLFLYRDFDLSLSKLNAKNNLKDATNISRKFRMKNLTKIESDLQSRLKKSSPLNVFEQEQLAFFLFDSIFKRRLFKTKKYLNIIRVDIKVISLFRALKCFVANFGK